MDPEKERRAAQLDGPLQQFIEAEKDGELDQHGEAATCRIDPLLLVELHHFLVHLLALVGVPLCLRYLALMDSIFGCAFCIFFIDIIHLCCSG